MDTTIDLTTEELFGIHIPTYVATLAHERNIETVRPTRSTFAIASQETHNA